jgi:hypothetical protein
MNVLMWLERSSVSAWINQSTSLFAYPTILLLHTIGLTLLVGINVAIDLRILGFAPQVPIAEMQKLFPVMWIGLALSVASGALLLTAKATTMGVNPAFYIKMACIVVAVSVVFAIRARVFRDPLAETRPVHGYGRVLAVVSMILWCAAITAGRVMAYVSEAAQFG